MAALPAAILVGLRHLGVGEQNGGLDFVVLVALVGAAGRRLEGKTDVKVGSIVRSLHADREHHGLGRPLGLQFLVRQALEVEVQRALFLVAPGTAFTLAHAGGAAVVGLLGRPFDRRDAGMEDIDVTLGHLAPVGCSDGCLGSERQQGDGSGNAELVHLLLLSNDRYEI